MIELIIGYRPRSSPLSAVHGCKCSTIKTRHHLGASSDDHVSLSVCLSLANNTSTLDLQSAEGADVVVTLLVSHDATISYQRRGRGT